MTDEEIISLYFDRSEEAIAATQRKYDSYCRTIVGRILSSARDTEEIISDTWLKAWLSIPPNRPRDLKLYLAKIGRHLALHRLRGTIDCHQDGLLYTSIPSDGGWHVYVDDEEADITLVGEVMVAVPLTEGSHTVEYIYRNDAFSLGWKISAICLLLFGITAPIYYHTRKKGKFEK